MDFTKEKNLRLVGAKNKHQSKDIDPFEQVYLLLSEGSFLGGLSSVIPAIITSAEQNKKNLVVLDSAVLKLLPEGQVQRLLRPEYVALEKEWLEIMVSGDKILNRKIDKLREVSNKRNNDFEISLCDTECLEEMLHTAVENLPQGKEIVTVEKIEKRFAVYGCTDALSWVFSELIFNAIKFQKAETKVNVFFSYSGRFQIHIKNIENKDYKPPEEIGPFCRTQKITNSDKYPEDLGIGAGLDTARQVLAKLGATLEISRKPDHTGPMLRGAIVTTIGLEYATSEAINFNLGRVAI